jgi:hypothetical protein
MLPRWALGVGRSTLHHRVAINPQSAYGSVTSQMSASVVRRE